MDIIWNCKHVLGNKILCRAGTKFVPLIHGGWLRQWWIRRGKTVDWCYILISGGGSFFVGWGNLGSVTSWTFVGGGGWTNYTLGGATGCTLIGGRGWTSGVGFIVGVINGGILSLPRTHPQWHITIFKNWTGIYFFKKLTPPFWIKCSRPSPS